MTLHFSRFPSLPRNTVPFLGGTIIFDAALLQVSEPSRKYVVLPENMIFENALFQILAFSKKYSYFFLELQFLGCAFACFGDFLFFPLFWN